MSYPASKCPQGKYKYCTTSCEAGFLDFDWLIKHDKPQLQVELELHTLWCIHCRARARGSMIFFMFERGIVGPREVTPLSKTETSAVHYAVGRSTRQFLQSLHKKAWVMVKHDSYRVFEPDDLDGAWRSSVYACYLAWHVGCESCLLSCCCIVLLDPHVCPVCSTWKQFGSSYKHISLDSAIMDTFFGGKSSFASWSSTAHN